MMYSKTPSLAFFNVLLILCAITLFPIFVFSQEEPVFFTRSTENNDIQIIHHGAAGLQKRLEMIQKAQSKILLEYFIFNPDRSGRILTQALIEKKRQSPNIQIKLLLDASPLTLRIHEALVSKLNSLGIEVRYYNPTPIYSILKAQYRDHRKLLIVDGPEGLECLTGSRNIADEYFEIHRHFNFSDRDIWIRGPIVKDIEDSFDDYWQNPRVEKAPGIGKPPKPFKNPKNQTSADQLYTVRMREYKKKIYEALDFVTENARDRFIKEQIERIGGIQLEDPLSQGTCSDLTFISDRPGFEIGKNATSPKRKVMKFISKRIENMNRGEKLWIESPYFIIEDSKAKDSINSLKEKNIEASLLTNGLSSTDTLFVAANFIPRSLIYQQIAANNIFLYSGKRPPFTHPILDSRGHPINDNSTFGIHSKTFVFGKSSFAVGTFNVDPRSKNLNSELMIFCEDHQPLTEYILKDINNRTSLSRALKLNGQTTDGESLLQGSSLFKKIQFYLALIPATLFQCLL